MSERGPGGRAALPNWLGGLITLAVFGTAGGALLWARRRNPVDLGAARAQTLEPYLAAVDRGDYAGALQSYAAPEYRARVSPEALRAAYERRGRVVARREVYRDCGHGGAGSYGWFCEACYAVTLAGATLPGSVCYRVVARDGGYAIFSTAHEMRSRSSADAIGSRSAAAIEPW